MFARRSLATFLSILFVATAMTPLATVTADSWTQGNVLVNGGFRDPTPVGHPQKFYCGPNNPGVEDPSGARTCDGSSAFVAFDWTAPDSAVPGIELVEGGIKLTRVEGQDTTFIQQHFNGTDGPDTMMTFYGVTITAHAVGASAGLRVDVRHDVGGVVENSQATPTFGSSSSTVYLAPSAFGLASGQDIKARSLRIWANDAIVIESVEMHAVTTNPLNTFAPSVAVGGDDSVVDVGKAVVHAPGADGKYTWIVRAVDDLGTTVPVENAVLCVYYAEGYPTDGFSSVGGTCPSSILGSSESVSYRTALPGGVFRFDVPADAIKGAGELPAGFYVWTSVEIDGTQHGVHATESWRPGFYNVAQLAAIAAGHGATAADWDQMPTPVLFDRDSDGKPDFVQFSEVDGYSVIVKPALSTQTPLATIVTPSVDDVVSFDVQVYKYDGALGAPMDISALGADLGIFDGTGLTQPTPKWIDEPFYTTDEGPVARSRPDAFTIRFDVPASEIPANKPLGVWAYVNLNGETRHTATWTFFGEQSGGTLDFYSVVRNAAAQSVAADAMRNVATPIILDAGSYTRDATLVIRADATADTLTPLDGTLVVGDNGDGAVTFSYAMVLPEDRTNVPASGSHAIAVYDAAGYASDGGQIGATGMAHALWTGQGTLVDGWYRADIPLSAFEQAKGPVGIWAYVDDVRPEYTLSRSGFYNYLKPAVASVSTSAAELALYAATPVVVLDDALGIPLALSSTINGAPTDLISVTNPVVNPGFEANWFVEGGIENNDANSAQMTAPPWFFRLDDKGQGLPTNPASTHRVVSGAGQLATNALEIRYNNVDYQKGLMIGQLFGAGSGTNGLIWQGSNAVSVDVKSTGPTNFMLYVALRYLDDEGNAAITSKGVSVGASSAFTTKTLPVVVPAGNELLGIYVTIESTVSQTITLDNIMIKGSKTALGDARSDLSDGYATIIEPRALRGGVQDALSGTSADYYVYDVSFVDYTTGTPTQLDLAGRAKTFALRTEEFQTETGSILQVRGSDDKFVAVVPAGDEPGAVAVPWAWTEASEQYQTFFIPEEQQSASGYYNPVKNALKATPLADQLDYGATPIAFGGASAGSIVGQQVLRFAPVPGGFGLFVDAAGEFVETAQVTVGYPNGPTSVYDVVISHNTGNRVNGVLLTAAQVEQATATSSDTLFTTGATVSPGTPLPEFTYCRSADLPSCVTTIQSLEDVAFTSTSVAPNGETLSISWQFGDGQTGNGASVAHSYAKAGAYTVNMTATSQSGKSATISKVVGIGNRAPLLQPLVLTPGTVYEDTSVVAVRAIASDVDGGVLSYAWTVNGFGVSPNVPALRVKDVLAEAGIESLVKGQTYTIGVVVSDGQGGSTPLTTKSFTVADHASVVSAPVATVDDYPTAEYALVLEEMTVTFDVADLDDDTIDAEVELDYDCVATECTVESWEAPARAPVDSFANGVATVAFRAGVSGLYTLRGVAKTPGGEVLGPAVTIDVRDNTAPTVELSGPELLQAFETGTYAASATDADNRSITLSWKLDGESVTAAEAFEYVTSAADVGEHTLEVTASDGVAIATDTLDIAVDDVLRLTLTMERAASEITDGHILRLKLTDVYGNPLKNHPVSVKDFYDPLPAAMDTQNLRTDSKGEAVFRLKPEAVVVGLPLTHRVVVTASAASVEGAPVDDIETVTQTKVFKNEAEPFAGLPLP